MFIAPLFGFIPDQKSIRTEYRVFDSVPAGQACRTPWGSDRCIRNTATISSLFTHFVYGRPEVESKLPPGHA